MDSQLRNLFWVVPLCAFVGVVASLLTVTLLTKLAGLTCNLVIVTVTAGVSASIAGTLTWNLKRKRMARKS